MSRKPFDKVHCVTQAWGGHPAPSPRGSCQHTIITDGKARLCGTECKGQLCDEHKHATAPLPGARRWPGGKAQSGMSGRV